MKQLEVQIMGQSYLLSCPEGGDARLLDAVERVDTAMCKIRDGGKVRARDRIAVLAALNLAFDLADRGPGAVAPATTPAAERQGSVASRDTPPGADENLLLDSLLGRVGEAVAGDGRLL